MKEDGGDNDGSDEEVIREDDDGDDDADGEKDGDGDDDDDDVDDDEGEARDVNPLGKSRSLTLS